MDREKRERKKRCHASAQNCISTLTKDRGEEKGNMRGGKGDIEIRSPLVALIHS